MIYTPMLISRYERLNNSYNGNPRYRIYWGDGTSSVTSSDHSFCYAIGNPSFRPGDTVEVSFTKAGRVQDMRTRAEVKAGSDNG
jgi:hypothetical protein